jgi:multidrug efflux system membrane fusion protein
MRRGPITAAVLIVATGVGMWWWINTPQTAPDAQRPSAGRRGPRAAAGADDVPVTAVTVKQQAVPVTREGIGTVQALNSVVVRSQVDGRLMSIAFTEGQMVKRGDLLAKIDPATYQAQFDQAVAKKAQDEATLANARLDLVRYKKLAESNAGPKQQADQQAALVAQLEAQVKSDDAAIANAQAILGYTTIASPIDGRTGLRSIDPGNIIKASDANGIVSITQLQPIAVVFTLPQRDLAAINAALVRGQAAVEVLDADGRSLVATGVLQTVDNQVDVTTGTIKLKATFPNGDMRLWPGQFVSARVTVETITGALVVPSEAVRRGPTGNFVYVIDTDMKARVRQVAVTMQDARIAVIGSGLNAGEQIVTLGFAQLADGKTVAIAASPDSNAAAPAPTGEEPKRRRGDRAKSDDQPAGEAGRERRRRNESGAGKSG